MSITKFCIYHFAVGVSLAAIIAAAGVLGLLWRHRKFDPSLPDLVLLGAIDSYAARLWMHVADDSQHLNITYLSGGIWNSVKGDVHDHVASVELLNLTESMPVEFRVMAGERLLASRTIMTAGSLETASFVWGSCMGRSQWPLDDLHAFEFIRLNLQPSFALFLGDNAYTDIHQALPYRLGFDQAYRQTLADPSLQRFLETTPSISQFDDHEIANDFAGADHPLVHEGMAAYARYVGSRNPQRTDYTWYTFAHGSLDFFVMDGRTHRTEQTLLGFAQRTALSSWLSGSSPGWKIIASPISWSSLGDGETYPEERTWLMQTIASSPAAHACRALILSGDIHKGAHFKHWVSQKQVVHELSASPFQALPFPANKFIGQQEHIAFLSGAKFHFGEVIPSHRASANRLDIRIWGYPILGRNPPEVLYNWTMKSCG